MFLAYRITMERLKTLNYYSILRRSMLNNYLRLFDTKLYAKIFFAHVQMEINLKDRNTETAPKSKISNTSL